MCENTVFLFVWLYSRPETEKHCEQALNCYQGPVIESHLVVLEQLRIHNLVQFPFKKQKNEWMLKWAGSSCRGTPERNTKLLPVICRLVCDYTRELEPCVKYVFLSKTGSVFIITSFYFIYTRVSLLRRFILLILYFFRTGIPFLWRTDLTRKLSME